MRAAQVIEHRKPYELRDVPIPKPQGHDLLIKIKIAGYCHTDGMVQEGDDSLPSGDLPLTGSHEPAGIVEEVGDKVTGFKKGDRVAAIAFKDPCGQCADCKQGPEKIRFCSYQQYIGLTAAGAFAEYALVDSRASAIIPDNLSFAQAAPLTCAGATIWSAILSCGLRRGQILAIVGLGALGHIGVQLSKALGLKTIGIDARPEPMELVKRAKHAPDLALNAKDGKDAILKAINDKFGEDGVDAVIDATGVSVGHELCLQILKKHSLFVLVGQPPDPIKVSFFDLIFRGITIKGSLLATTKQFQELLKFVGDNDIKVDVHSYKIDDINKLVDDSHKPGVTGKAIVSFE